MGEESGRGSGRVGSDFLSAIAGRVNVSPGRVGSGRVGSGRVQEKWPVDNSEGGTGGHPQTVEKRCFTHLVYQL